MKLKRFFLKDIEEWSRQRPLSIVGPTGGGKTSTLLSFLRSSGLSPLLISLDSVAAYKELDIGSSKPMGADYSDFNWVGLSFVSPTEKMNVSLMRDTVMPALAVAKKKDLPIIFIGGTHFYERFVLEGAAPGQSSCPTFQKELVAQGSSLVLESLVAKDKRWGEFLHPNDEYRVFRYADLVLRQSKTFAELRLGSQNPLFGEIECLVINPDKQCLEEKLKVRILQMLKLGWIEETRKLLEKYGRLAPALQSVGYAEILEFFEQGMSIDLTTLSEQILIRHRQLAKQQRTWIRKLLEQS